MSHNPISVDSIPPLAVAKDNRSALRVGNERFGRFAERQPLLFAMIIMAVLYSLTVATFTPVFDTNDDVIMGMIASGTVCANRPDEHLVFSHIGIGVALKNLYQLVPNVPWYAIYLLVVQYLSFTGILYACLSWRRQGTTLLGFFLIYAIVGVQLLVRLQFTITAIWAVESGLFIALTAFCLRKDGRSWRGLAMLSGGLALMVLGSLIRVEAYTSVMIVSVLPVASFLWWLNHGTAPHARTVRCALLAVVILQIAVSGLQFVDDLYYSKDPRWKEFLSFNPIRVKFNDYRWTSYTSATKPVFDRAGWSENDHEMIRVHYLDDPEIFGKAKMTEILKDYPWAMSRPIGRNVVSWWKDIVRNRPCWSIWLQLPLFIWLARSRRFALTQILLMTASINVALTGVMLLKCPVFRVYYPLFALLPLYGLLVMRCGGQRVESTLPNHERKCGWLERVLSVLAPHSIEPALPDVCRREISRVFQDRWSVIAVALAFVGLLNSDVKAIRRVWKSTAAHGLLLADLKELNPRDEELYIGWNLSYEPFLPLVPQDRYPNFHLLSMGWLIQSPLNERVKVSFGIDNLTRALLERPDVFLICEAEKLPLITTYCEEHHRVKPQWKLRFQGNSFSVWKPVVDSTITLPKTRNDR